MRLSIAVLFSLLPAIIATPIHYNPNAAPSIAPLNTDGQTIDHSYIVVFKKGINENQVALHLDHVVATNNLHPLVGSDSGIEQVWAGEHSKFGIYGYAGKFSAESLAAIRSSPEVAYVERDQIVHTQEELHGVDNVDDIVTERSAPWGLARISHRQTRFSTLYSYSYDGHGGEDVTAYIIDTGVSIDHVEFEGRARWGKTIPRGDRDIDGNGHGTHVAGTIGSRKYGVAKKADLVAVKVLGTNGSGTMQDVISGVIWAAEDAAKTAAAAAAGKSKNKGSVANMSLGGGKSQALDDAVDEAVDSGLHFAVAAGNDNRDACEYSPAASKLAVTVGASTSGDERAYFSNFGKCVDIFAPGLMIKSTWPGPSDREENVISGTSMASPHIAGLLAYLVSIEGSNTFSILEGEELIQAPPSLYAQAYEWMPALAQKVLPSPEDIAELERVDGKKKPLTPARLKKALIALATPGALSDAGGRSLPAGSPNLLAFNNATATPGRRNW